MNDLRADLPCLTVSIVVYNSSLELLSRTLHSLQVATRRVVPELLSGVVVTLVDNASDLEYRSGLAGLIDRMPPAAGFSVERADLPQNLGYGAGHNRALAGNRGTFHLVLNPDVELAEDALLAGVNHLQSEPGAVLLSPRAQGPDGEQEFLCKRYPSVLVLLMRAFAPGLGQTLFAARMAEYQMSDACSGAEPAEIPLASGCFMLVRGEALRSVGGFDDAYFLYFEDFDLSLRLAPLGQLLYLPSMQIVHHGGYAGRKGLSHVKLFISAGIRFFRQHGWRWF